MSLLFASPGHDPAAFERGHAIANGACPGGLVRVEGLPAGWQCRIGRAFAEASVEDDLVVLVSGSPRRAAPGGDPGATRPVSAAEIAADWRRSGPASLAALSADFALVIAEPAAGRVHGYVDPFGLNSLFCTTRPGLIVFGTESLAVAAVCGEAILEPGALQDVVNLRFLSGRRALWQGVRQVLPGTLLTLGPLGEPSESEIARIRFRPAMQGGNVAAAAGHVRALLEAAFARRRDEGMDHVVVPLSGGVDSSILASLAVRTFPNVIACTAHIEGFDNRELERASEVARHVGIRHRIVNVTQADVCRLYPHVVARIQEPPRHFNNFVIARIIEAVASDCAWIVAGDTGDLLFGGDDLNTVHHLARKRRALGQLNPSAQRVLARVLRMLPGHRPASLSRIAEASFDELIQAFDVIPRSVEASKSIEAAVRGRRPSAELVAAHYECGHGSFEAFQTWHERTFLTSIYRRNDRLSRAKGMRYWYPLMEPAIVDYATRIPSAMKFDVERTLSKPILRSLCDELVAPGVSAWSKAGFPSPERAWMTGPLEPILQASRADDALIGEWFGPGLARRLEIARDHQALWTLMTLETVLQSARSATAGR